MLARLLQLNHERYEQEKAQGLHDKKGKRSGAGQGRRRSTATPAESLFPDKRGDASHGKP